MEIIKKIYRAFLSYTGSSSQKCKYLRKQGAKIGENVVLNGDLATFGTEPYMIEVGDNSLIAWGVKIITHDGGIRVLNNLKKFGNRRADKIGKVIIGKNSYIGMNAIIMPGVKIGDNTIIGAGSVVTKDVEDGTIVAGVPAKKISNINDYYLKNRNRVRFTANYSKKQKRNYYENIKYVDMWPEDDYEEE